MKAKTDEFSAFTEQHAMCNNCLRNPNYLIVDKKQASRLAAGIVISAFSIFCAGYFFGKKHINHEFSSVMQKTSFSDQMDFALTSLYDQNRDCSPKQIMNQELILSDTRDSKINLEIAKKQETPQKKFIAKLFGGNKKNVTDFAARLKRHGIDIIVKKRISKTAQGATMVWHQALTQSFDNKDDLISLIAMIQKLENIKDITVVEVLS